MITEETEESVARCLGLLIGKTKPESKVILSWALGIDEDILEHVWSHTLPEAAHTTQVCPTSLREYFKDAENLHVE